MSAITKEQLDFFSGFLRARSGYDLLESKAYLLEARLKSVLNEHKLPDISALVAALSSQSAGKITEDVVEAMTINETSFFRDQSFFDTLERDILPALAQMGRTRRVRIWSAACSTGQEPYSLAMLIEKNRRAYPAFQYEIIASDINSRVVETARQGIFSDIEINRGVPSEYREKFFMPKNGAWEISQDIRQKVQFRCHNLKDSFIELGVFDLILLRNVLIYFDADLKDKTFAKIARSLSPDGYLMLGAAEGIHDPHHGLVRSETIRNVFHHRARRQS